MSFAFDPQANSHLKFQPIPPQNSHLSTIEYLQRRIHEQEVHINRLVSDNLVLKMECEQLREINSTDEIKRLYDHFQRSIADKDKEILKLREENILLQKDNQKILRMKNQSDSIVANLQFDNEQLRQYINALVRKIEELENERRVVEEEEEEEN